MRRTTISIAMATFNGATYLQAQLESFARQTQLPDELVVCDDKSLDDTYEILQQFKANAPFSVRIMRNSLNIGYIRNFEKAISLCSSDIVFLSDQDDVWFDDKIDKMVSVFHSRPNVMVALNDQIITRADLESTGATKLTNIRRYGGPEKHFVTGCCSAHRRVWQSIVFPIPKSAPAHDNWINGLAHELGAVVVLREPLQLYRRHNANVSHALASSAKQITRLDRWRRFDPWSAQAGWRRTLAYYDDMSDRITKHEELLTELGYGTAASELADRLRSRRRALSDRIGIYEISGAARWRRIFGLWRSGGYREFGGLRSIIKDILWWRSPGDAA